VDNTYTESVTGIKGFTQFSNFAGASFGCYLLDSGIRGTFILDEFVVTDNGFTIADFEPSLHIHANDGIALGESISGLAYPTYINATDNISVLERIYQYIPVGELSLNVHDNILITDAPQHLAIVTGLGGYGCMTSTNSQYHLVTIEDEAYYKVKSKEEQIHLVEIGDVNCD
jgi:hypothetical protein